MDKRDPIEAAKKFMSYADAVTAFAILQSLAFLSAYSGSTGKNGVHDMSNALFFWMVILDAASFFYSLVLLMCYRAESALLGKPNESTPVSKWTRRFRWLRLWCVVGSFIITNVPVMDYLARPMF
jgi:hypothetical protein